MSVTEQSVLPPNYNFGQLAFERLGRYKDRIFLIDAATGEEESYGSVLNRSIRLAQALRAFGLSPGDVVAISGPNRIDVCISFFASLFNGLQIIGVDPYSKYDEVRGIFDLTKPKLAFCQNESYDTYARAAVSLNLDVKIVTFDEGDHKMSKFSQKYESLEQEDFKVAEYDVEKIYPFLISTSGSSGKLKIAAFKNKSMLLKDWLINKYQDKSMTKTLLLSPVHWIAFYFFPTGVAFLGGTLILTSKFNNYSLNMDHLVEVINKYRPQIALFTPSLITYLLVRKEEVDMTSFRRIIVGGCKFLKEVRQEFKKLLAEDCLVMDLYGQTEMIGPFFGPRPLFSAGSVGVPLDGYTVELVDPDTGVEITEANVTGEIYVKGPGFSEYYNDPEETKNSFTEDGFFKTGDLLYRDERNNYFFVDRIKTLIKYRCTHIYPIEIEEVIREHPAVAEVCVVGINAPFVGEVPAACVVRREGYDVTAQEIKDLVASKLSENKELRGGVLFLDTLPYTSTGKILRNKLMNMAMQIDAATGEEESYGSVLNRSIRLAQALRAFGLSPGDVVAISGPNHIDICIPFFAALFNGLPITRDKIKIKGVLRYRVITKSLVLSPNHWMSFSFAPTLVAARGGLLLLTSKYNNYNFNVTHVTELIKKYRPVTALFCPSLIPSIVLEAQKNEIDMTSLRRVTIAGSKLFDDVFQEFKKLLGDNCHVLEPYGLTEMIGAVFDPSSLRTSRSCGVPIDIYTVKLVDPDTGVEIKEANVTGELLVKGPCFSEYYNDPEETAKAFTEDGFFKSGDLLYRDEDYNYFFVDRLKTLIKYRGTHIYPLQVEEVIREHPGVADVCVVGIDDPVELQKSAACVVRHKGSDVTAQEIKDLVASKLSENKKLWGGVLFFDKLPYTSTGKVLRGKVKEMAMTAERE
ncbi:luciferin 4-monooxygenase [Bicyclus anynana]|uniref:Luciferin 4-monooxygenase n=1 Tax=Bicyclus anynana TaxID=110368 RepID=A0A6J1N5K9_BICAN|nr:luciferin 4-monooxygenase [Bicyclus anynana]